jgi:hypothetical protein
MSVHQTPAALQPFVDRLRDAIQGLTFSEAGVLKVLVEARKTIDLSSTTPPAYEVVELFCDWALHTTIDRGTIRIRRFFQSFDITDGMSMQQWFESKYFGQFVLLRGFRKAFAQLLNDNGLPTRLVDDDEAWFEFVYLYAGVVASTPILDSKNGALPGDVAKLQLDRLADSTSRLESVRVRVTLKDGRDYFSMHLLPLRRLLPDAVYQYQLQKIQRIAETP